MDEKFRVTFLLCDPGWYVHSKPDAQNKWETNTNTRTHTTLNKILLRFLQRINLTQEIAVKNGGPRGRVDKNTSSIGSRNNFNVVLIINGIFRKHHVAERAGREQIYHMGEPGVNNIYVQYQQWRLLWENRDAKKMFHAC